MAREMGFSNFTNDRTNQAYQRLGQQFRFDLHYIDNSVLATAQQRVTVFDAGQKVSSANCLQQPHDGARRGMVRTGVVAFFYQVL